MSKTINITIEFEDDFDWNHCYGEVVRVMRTACRGTDIEDWQSCDTDWFNNDGTELTPEEISSIRKKHYESLKHD